MRGRKPKPTYLKILEGNPGQRPLNKNEPKPKRVRPSCPRWLSKEAKAEWSRVVPELDRLGLLTLVDRAALSGYCESWAEYREAREWVHNHGSSYPIFERDEDNNIKHDDRGQPILRYMQQVPQVSIAHRALEQIRAFCSEFGLTPSARSRMHVPGQEEPEDEMERLLSRSR
jgi:P27 family predicted phage terminase small subunit